MKLNIVLAGVGGQGILTIARLLSMCAMRQGLHVKQAEVHGMSQRGGEVYSHLRLSHDPIHSDLIPLGQADLILAVEPLEALRYLPMLTSDGKIVASTNAEANIANYPSIEAVLEHIARVPGSITLDVERLARAAGSVLAANVVALGAAMPYLPFTADDVESSIEALFGPKGERIVEANRKAFRYGRTAASAYRDALARGATPSTARSWIDALPGESLASEDDLDFSGLTLAGDLDRLSGAEAHAFENLLYEAYDEGRRTLYEHEVYRLIELVGAISPPRHTFIPKGSTMAEDILAAYPGERVVVKLVSPDVTHKSDVGAVAIVPRTLDAVRTAIDQMIVRHAPHVSVAGALVVEFVEHDSQRLGSELFVGIRATREFGPVIAAGLGGVQTEYLAANLRSGAAVAKALAMDTSAEEFMETFRKTVAYEIISGQVRGGTPLVADDELLRCFRAFIGIARRFCVDRGEEGPDLGEMEVNPFAFAHHRLIPLDGRGQLAPAAKAAKPRPSAHVDSLLEPKRLAIIGVSSKPDALGRIILQNTLKAGFSPANICIVKPGETALDGVICVPDLNALEEPVDVLISALPASEIPAIIAEANASGKVRAGILIAGGAGETEGSESLGEAIAEAIAAGRNQDSGGAVFVGPNCMGLQSHAGNYNTFFVPEDRLPGRYDGEPSPLALVSQSGAFVVSRLSSLEGIVPNFSISIGNQADATVSDFLDALLPRADVRVAGVYVEGFANWDGLAVSRSIRRWREAGKTVVIYKAGRTDAGRTAASGHTAAIAGDYDICKTALGQAGALVAESFREFDQLLQVAVRLERCHPTTTNLFAITNAGMEAVGMGDAIPRTSPIRFPFLSGALASQLQNLISEHGLGSLVSVSNPLDVTPMADEAAYSAMVDAALESPDIGAVIVSCVPLAPRLKTLAESLAEPNAFPAIAARWRAQSTKPIVFVLDSGSEFDALAEAVGAAGLPVFRAADEAARRLTKWLEHKMMRDSEDKKGGEQPVQAATP